MMRAVGFTSPWVTLASTGQRVVHIQGTFTPNATRADVSAPPPAPAPSTCPACNGRGHHNEVTCEGCYGRGVTT